MPKHTFKRHYSGKASGAFWAAIDGLPLPQKRILFAIACRLEDLESTVLIELENALLGDKENSHA